MPSQNETGKKKHRTTKACDQCRQKRIKCDGQTPCHSCHNFNQSCTYLDSSKKRGPPKGYIETVESQLQFYKDLVDLIIKKYPDSSWISDEINKYESSTPSKFSFTNTEDSPTPEKEYSEDDEDNKVEALKELRVDFADLKMSTKGRKIFIGTSSGFSLVGKDFIPPTPEMSPDQLFHTVSKALPVKNPDGYRKIMTPEVELLWPDKQTSFQLIWTFFKYVHPFLPILHRNSFLNEWKNNQVSPLLLSSVYAISYRFTDGADLSSPEMLNQNHAAQCSLFYLTQAKSLIPANLDRSNVSTVQALLLLTSVIIPSLPWSTWFYLGSAIRISIDIGLHRDPEKFSYDNSFDKYEIENRRRAWWGCFYLDSVIAALFGRPLSIFPESSDTKFPQLEETADILHDISTLPLSFIHKKIELSQILNDIIQNIYSLNPNNQFGRVSPEKKLLHFNTVLNRWLENLPVELRYSVSSYNALIPPSPLCKGHIHVFYHLLRLILHRPFIAVKGRPRTRAMKVLDSLRICTNSAKALSDILQATSRVDPIYCSPYDCAFLFNAIAMSLIASSSNKPVYQQLFQNILLNSLETMRNWGRLWQPSALAYDALKPLANCSLTATLNDLSETSSNLVSLQGDYNQSNGYNDHDQDFANGDFDLFDPNLYMPLIEEPESYPNFSIGEIDPNAYVNSLKNLSGQSQFFTDPDNVAKSQRDPFSFLFDLEQTSSLFDDELQGNQEFDYHIFKDGFVNSS